MLFKGRSMHVKLVELRNSGSSLSTIPPLLSGPLGLCFSFLWSENWSFSSLALLWPPMSAPASGVKCQEDRDNKNHREAPTHLRHSSSNQSGSLPFLRVLGAHRPYSSHRHRHPRIVWGLGHKRTERKRKMGHFLHFP